MIVTEREKDIMRESARNVVVEFMEEYKLAKLGNRVPEDVTDATRHTPEGIGEEEAGRGRPIEVGTPGPPAGQVPAG